MLDRFGPDRVIDTPISEAGFLAWASGGDDGLRPIIEFMSWSFTLGLHRPDRSTTPPRSATCPAGSTRCGHVRGGNGIAHQLAATHSHRMESVYARIPAWSSITPSTPAEFQGAAQGQHPCDDPGDLPRIEKC